MAASTRDRVARWAEEAKLGERLSADRIGDVGPSALHAFAVVGVALVAVAAVVAAAVVAGAIPGQRSDPFLLRLLLGVLGFAAVSGGVGVALALMSTGVLVADRRVLVLGASGSREFSLTKETRFTASAKQRCAVLRLGPCREQPVPELGTRSRLAAGGGRLKRRVAVANAAVERGLYGPATPHPPVTAAGPILSPHPHS